MHIVVLTKCRFKLKKMKTVNENNLSPFCLLLSPEPLDNLIHVIQKSKSSQSVNCLLKDSIHRPIYFSD